MKNTCLRSTLLLSLGITALLAALLLTIPMISQKTKQSLVDSSIITAAKQGDIIIKNGRGTITYEFTPVNADCGQMQEYLFGFNKPKLSLKDILRFKFIRNTSRKKPKTMFAHITKALINYAFEGQKKRIDSCSIFDDRHLFLEKRAYNGSTTTVMYKYKSKSNTTPRRISGEQFSGNEYFDPRFYGWYIAGQPVSEFLQSHTTNYAGEEIINGFDCIKFDGLLGNEKKSCTVWLAKELYYRPVCVEIEEDQKIHDKPLISVIHTDYKKYEKNVFFPLQIVRETCIVNKKTGERDLFIRETIIIHDDFTLNADIPVALFDITGEEPFEVPESFLNYDYDDKKILPDPDIINTPERIGKINNTKVVSINIGNDRDDIKIGRQFMSYSYISPYNHSGLDIFVPDSYRKNLNYPGGRLFYSDDVLKHQSVKFSQRFVVGGRIH